MRVKFLGCGDAFGSGGRFNTCFLADQGEASFLIDCGASALISMRRFNVDPNCISAIFLSHLHADHFGGLPFFILDAQLVSRRARPLIIAGPEGLGARLEALMEAQFPGSAKVARDYLIEIVELPPGRPVTIDPVTTRVTAYLVKHPSGTPSLALRIESGGRIISYTGDTEWTESLLTAGHDADLLIAEAYSFERKVRFHLDYATLREKLPLIGAKRVVLTHMSAEMLARIGEMRDIETASDGLEIEIS